MAPSLRDRKKAATMHRIQEIAVDLFEHRSFEVVTIEEVATAAEVSPSTVYRYFGTKEGLVIHDQHDDLLFDAVSDALAEKDLWSVIDEALALIDQAHFVEDADLTMRRTRLWFGTPAVRNATFGVADELIDRFAADLVASEHHDYAPDEARVVIASQVWGIIAAIEGWYHAGAQGSLGQHLRRMIPLIRPAMPGKESA